MAAIVLADVTAVAADVTAVPALILSWVNGNGINVDAFDGESGDTTKLARCYLAAHLALISASGGSSGGAVVSESEGGISKTYAAVALSPGELGRTAYGSQFRWLCKVNAGGAWLA